MDNVTLTREEIDRINVLANLMRHPSPTIPPFDLEGHLEEHAIVHNSLYFSDCSDPNEIFDLRLLYQTRDMSYHINTPERVNPGDWTGSSVEAGQNTSRKRRITASPISRSRRNVKGPGELELPVHQRSNRLQGPAGRKPKSRAPSKVDKLVANSRHAIIDSFS